MIDTNDLKEKIRTTIFPNGRGAINAADHQALLLDMADGIGAMNDKLNAVATDTESNNVAIEDLQENKVDHGSYAPDLSVGVADHLAGHDEPTPSEFTFRKSGGGAILSGNARVQSVKGNSVVWNQLINNILSDTTYQKAWYPRRGVNYASIENGEIELRFDSQSDAFGNSLRQQIDVRPGDKIYISYDYESHNVDEFGRRVFMAFTAGWSSKAVLSDNCLAKGGEVVGHAEGFSIVPSDNSINALCIYFCYTNITSPDTTPLKIANFRFVNLTRMFGAGNEPTTIEEYHSRIPQGIDIDAYNGGEVVDMRINAIESCDADGNICRVQSLDIISRYFPDGMKSAGSAHDEIRYNKATQKWEKVVRIGEVDMGDMEWTLTPQMYFRALLPSDSIAPTNTDYNGFICAKYERVDFNLIYGQQVASPCFGIPANNPVCCVVDSSYTDAASFKAAMAGVMLYYELANPIVTEIQETFNLDYEVWNGGTEHAIADTPTSAFKADIIYGFNAYGVIKELREQLATLQAVIAKMNV